MSILTCEIFQICDPENGVVRNGGDYVTMPIPALNDDGLLPTFHRDPKISDRSPFQATMREIVEAFGYTDHRRNLLRSLLEYRSTLAEHGFTSGLQFINGSFVQNVEDLENRYPRDIDLFSVLSVPKKYMDDRELWQREGLTIWKNVVLGPRAGLHIYAELNLSVNFRHFLYWHDVFSQQRDTFNPKGYIVSYLDSVADRDAQDALEVV